MIPVLVAPQSQPAHDVRRILAGWSRSGLLRSGLWVTPDQAGHHMASWIDDADHEEPLVDELMRREFTELLVVSVIPCAGQVDDDLPAFIAAQWDLVERLREGLGDRQELCHLTLAVPLRHPCAVPPAALETGATTLLLVPEQRVAPGQFAVPVTPDNQAVHAAGAAASVGLLWADRPGEPRPPTLAPERDNQPDARFQGWVELTQPEAPARPVLLIRHFVRAVLLDEERGRLQRDALALRRDADLIAEAAGGVPASRPGSLVEAWVDELVRRHADVVTFQPPPEFKAPAQQPIPVGEALNNMFRFIGSALRRLPRETFARALEKGQRAVVEFAQQQTYGRDSVVSVQWGDGTSASPASQAGDDAGAALRTTAVDVADRVLALSTAPERAAPRFPQLWQELRATVFMLHDGSDPPQGLASPSDGRDRLIVTDPWRLAPDPADLLPGGSAGAQNPAPVRSCDPRGVAQILGPVATQPAPAAAAADAAPDPQFDRLGGEDENDHDLRDGSEPMQSAGGAAGQTADDDLAQDPVEPGIPGAGHRSAVADATLAWVQRRRGALTWQFADRVAQAQDAASRALLDRLDYLRSLDASSVAPAVDDSRSRRWLSIGWPLAAVTVVLVATLVGRSLTVTRGWAPGFAMILVAVGALAALLLTWFIQFLLYQRALFQAQYARRLQWSRYLHHVDSIYPLAQQVTRLEAVYRQLQDWSDVLGSLLHHALDARSHAGADGAFEPETSPACTLPAQGNVWMETGTPSEVEHRRLASRVARQLFRRRWLAQRYREVETAAIQAHARRLGRGEPEDDDRDVGEPGRLEVLADGLTTGAWEDELSAHVAGALLAVLDDLDLSQVTLCEGSISAGAFLEELSPPAAPDGPGGPGGHLEPCVLTADAVVQQQHRISAQQLWLLPPHRQLADLGRSRGVVRLDRSDPLRPDQVNLLAGQQEAAAPQVVWGADDETL